MMDVVPGRFKLTAIIRTGPGAASARFGWFGIPQFIPPTTLGPTLGIGCVTGALVGVGRPSGGICEVMSTFITRVESDVMILKFEAAAGLNDFRNSALRD